MTSKQTNITIHDRPITDLHFNHDGDLLFSASKDTSACLIRTSGEKIGDILGTYEGHDGAILSLSPDKSSTFLATGGADNKIKLWDVCTGKCLGTVVTESMVRSVFICPVSGNILYVCDDSFGKRPVLGFIDVKTFKSVNCMNLESVPTKALINFSEQAIVVSDTDGVLKRVDARMNTIDREKRIHTSCINNMRNSFCNSFFITASADAQAKVMSYDFEEAKVFVSEDPINAAVIFRSNDKVVCAGGINARDVTTTRTRANFMVNFYDAVTADNVGSYSTHFGTINCVDIHPSGNMYCSGGEEGIVCIVEFGDDFANAPFTDLSEEVKV